MRRRVLEGFQISDEAIYCFGDLTAVVTFKGEAIDKTYVGATFGDFSDAALLNVLMNGQTLNDVQQWLAYIEPDAIRSANPKRKAAIAAVLGDKVETFCGKDGSGKGWVVGFDGTTFAFIADNSEAQPQYIAVEDLNVVSTISITSNRIDANSFVVNSPSAEMESWLNRCIGGEL